VTELQALALTLVAVAATAVVATRDPLKQALVNSAYGFLLVVVFTIFQAPDVALSMLAVGCVAFPLVLLTSIARTRGRGREDEK
jgi:energy-converting hydrogenase B subunit D